MTEEFPQPNIDSNSIELIKVKNDERMLVVNNVVALEKWDDHVAVVQKINGKVNRVIRLYIKSDYEVKFIPKDRQ